MLGLNKSYPSLSRIPRRYNNNRVHNGRTSSFTVANRSIGEWLSSLPTLILLLLTIFLSSGEVIHSQLLKIGETPGGLLLLRGAGMVEQPTCNRDPDLTRNWKPPLPKKRQMADDPLAGIFGTEVDEGALRTSLEASREICRDRWDRYEMIQEKATPGVIAFRTLEGGVAKIVTSLGNYKRLLLCLLVIICAATATLTRHHISLRPPRTRKDHLVATGGQLAANVMLLMSAWIYRGEEVSAMADGVQVNHFYLHQFWIAGFIILSLAALYQLVRPPKDLEEGGTWGSPAERPAVQLHVSYRWRPIC